MAQTGTLLDDRLAELSIDLFHKIKAGQISLDELERFLKRQNPFGDSEEVKALLRSRDQANDPLRYQLDSLELWLHPEQQAGVVSGHQIYYYLEKEGLLQDCLSLQDLEEIQKLGIDVFRRYFAGKRVFAWKSIAHSRGDKAVPFLSEAKNTRRSYVALSRALLYSREWDASSPALRFR